MDDIVPLQPESKKPQAATALVTLSTIFVGLAHYIPSDPNLKPVVASAGPLVAVITMSVVGRVIRWGKTWRFCAIVKETIKDHEAEHDKPGTTAKRKRELRKKIDKLKEVMQEQQLSQYRIE